MFVRLVATLFMVVALVGCGDAGPDLSSPESAKSAMATADVTLAERALSKIGSPEGLGANVREVTAYKGEVKVWTSLADTEPNGDVAEAMALNVVTGCPNATSVWVLAENLSPFDRWTPNP